MYIKFILYKYFLVR